MKKLVILGAGAQGGPCASILANTSKVKEIILADFDIENTKKIVKKIGDKRLLHRKVDANNIQNIIDIAEGAEVIINLVNPIYNTKIMQACLQVGAHYVDTSVGETFDLDLMASDNFLSRMIKGESLMFHEEFKSKGLSCIIGCGASPGTTNVFARYLYDKLDIVDEIKIRFGRKGITNNNEIVSPWAPGWSPERALWGYAIKPTVFVNGKFEFYPIYSGYEEYEFHDPIGTVPQVYHQHPEQITIPYFLDKSLKYCDFKFTVDYGAGVLCKQGFGDPNTTVIVDGKEVSPNKLLMEMVKRPVNNFLDENETDALEPFTSLAGACIEVNGLKNGEQVKYKLSYTPTHFETPEEKRDLIKKFGTSLVYVALPAIVSAQLAVKGKVDSGVISPECIDPILYLKTMAEMGCKIKFRETRYKVSGIS